MHSWSIVATLSETTGLAVRVRENITELLVLTLLVISSVRPDLDVTGCSDTVFMISPKHSDLQPLCDDGDHGEAASQSGRSAERLSMLYVRDRR